MENKIMLQKVMGIIMLLMSLLILIVASHEQAGIDSDASAIMIMVPVGLILLFSKECCII